MKPSKLRRILGGVAPREPEDPIERALRSSIGRGFLKHVARHGEPRKGRKTLVEALGIVARRLPSEDPKRLLETAVGRTELDLSAAAIMRRRPTARRERGHPDTRGFRSQAIRSIVKRALLRRERSAAARLAAVLYEAYLGPDDPSGPIRAAQALSSRAAYGAG